MTKELQDKLKLVAGLLGLRIDSHNGETWLVDIENLQSIYHNVSIEDWKFHTSWEWQIPVWAKLCRERDMGYVLMGAWDEADSAYFNAIKEDRPQEGFDILAAIIERIEN